MSKTRVAIVYHSGYGHTRRQAEAVRDGVGEVAGAEALLLNVEEAQKRWDDLALADAIIFGAPTYVGSVTAAFKAFQEASSHLVMTKGFKWKDKIAAGFTNSGSRSGDKLATLIQLVLFAAQHGMHWVNLALPPANHSSTGSERELNRLGFWLGAGAQSNVDQGPDLAPPDADLATARHLGRRVAEVTLQFVGGRKFLELDPEKRQAIAGKGPARTKNLIEQAVELDLDALAGGAAVPSA
jgi:NAD(P)H dehydrogenase (quinone)